MAVPYCLEKLWQGPQLRTDRGYAWVILLMSFLSHFAHVGISLALLGEYIHVNLGLFLKFSVLRINKDVQCLAVSSFTTRFVPACIAYLSETTLCICEN